jgi:Ser/Thr protein kinase RdoA (MazF antagonist)
VAVSLDNNNRSSAMQTAATQKTMQKMLTTRPPTFSEAEAVNIAASHFGIKAEKKQPLVSERDQNFRLDTKQDKRFTLKISNEAEQESVIDFQNRALIHIAEKDASIPLARVIPTLNGQLHCSVERAGKTHYVRVLSWLDGMVLNDAVADATLANSLGRLLALLGLALADFDHPGSNPPLLWDMKRAAGLRELVVHIQEPGLRQMISQTLGRFVSKLKPILDTLRTQVIYNDMNLDNVLMDETRPDRIRGLIDFGDLVKSPLIIDLAVAAAYQLSEGDDPLAGALPMIAGYHAIRPLQIKEIALLTDLIRTRLITSLLIGTYRSILFPENSEYLMNSHHSAKNFLFNLSSLSADDAFERITAVCP